MNRGDSLIDPPTLRRRRFLAALGAGASPASAPASARAQAAWPGKPVRIIVPFTPGHRHGHPGAHPRAAPAGRVGTGDRRRQPARAPRATSAPAQVAKSPPDGLTLLMGVNTLIINPALYANMTYDPLKDLAPIGLAATGSFLLVAAPALEA